MCLLPLWSLQFNVILKHFLSFCSLRDFMWHLDSLIFQQHFTLLSFLSITLMYLLGQRGPGAHHSFLAASAQFVRRRRGLDHISVRRQWGLLRCCRHGKLQFSYQYCSISEMVSCLCALDVIPVVLLLNSNLFLSQTLSSFLSPQVVGLDCYTAADRTSDAKAIAKSFATSFSPAASSAAASGGAGTSNNGTEAPFNHLPWRCPSPATLGCGSGAKITARGAGRLQYGEREVELGLVEQLVEESQVRAIGDSLKLMAATAASSSASLPPAPPTSGSAGAPPPNGSVAALLAHWKQSLDARGLDALNPGFYHGAYARPRAVEVAAAMNRLRGATFNHVAKPLQPPSQQQQQQQQQRQPVKQGK